MARDYTFYRDRAEQALAAGFTTKAAKQCALTDLSSAYDCLREEISQHYYSLPLTEQTEAMRKAYWGLPHNLVHWRDTHTALVREAYGDRFETTLDCIAGLRAMREDVVAAPVAAKRKRVEPESGAPRHTCQVCGRSIKAPGGHIAHHGYQRPGWGYQTSSCEGAGYAPFEVSRERLGHVIAKARDHQSWLENELECRTVRLRLRDYDERTGVRGRTSTRFAVYEDNFDEVRATAPKTFRSAGILTFADAVAHRRRATLAEIEATIAYIESQQARYDAWQPKETGK